MKMWDTAERGSTGGFVRENVTKAPGETARQIIKWAAELSRGNLLGG